MNNQTRSEAACLRCKNDTVYRAEISTNEGEVAITLRTEHQKVGYCWSLPSVAFPRNEIYVCWRCGFIWNQIEPQEFRRIMLRGKWSFVAELQFRENSP